MDRKGPGKIEHTDIVPTALHKDLTSVSFGVFTLGTYVIASISRVFIKIACLWDAKGH